VIICDDCSNDNTVQIIQKYMVKYPSIIQLYINEKQLKTIKNFEKAISLTTGDYIFLCDQDDIWMPQKVQKMIKNMKENPRALLLFSNGDLIDDDGTYLNTTLWKEWGFDENAKKIWEDMSAAFSNLLYNKNYVTGATVLFNQNLKKIAMPINLPNGYYHDTWFAIHAAGENGLFYMDESLIKYRIHKNQQVGITKGGANSHAVFNANNISVEQFVKKIYKKFPKQKPKTSLIIKLKIFIYNLIYIR
jgi:glycosyltransferase involved in cell wall biosynthesis